MEFRAIRMTTVLIFVFLLLTGPCLDSARSAQDRQLPFLLLLLSSKMQLVKDINPGEGSGPFPLMMISISDFIPSMISFQDHLFFPADDSSHGMELWASDGTSAGTAMVSDINPGGGHSTPVELTTYNDALYFFAFDNTNGWELRKTIYDSVQQNFSTTLVKDINPGAADCIDPEYTQLTVFKSRLFFGANDGINGMELWQSDGTEGGTSMVENFIPGIGGLSPLHLTPSPQSGLQQVNQLFLVFSGSTFLSGRELYKYSFDTNTAQWKISKIKNIYSGLGDGVPLLASSLFADHHPAMLEFDDDLYFVGDDGTNGQELWKTDGTLTGTVMVDDINQSGDSLKAYLTPAFAMTYEEKLFFIASDGTNRELWKTDGTMAGTLQASTVTPPGGSINILETLNNSLYFHTILATAQQTSTAIWRRYWSPEQNSWRTEKVADGLFTYGNLLRSIISLEDINGRLYFSGNGILGNQTTDYGFELWQLDSSGTFSMTKDQAKGPDDFFPVFLTEHKGHLYFFADDGVHGYELWKLKL